MSANRSDHFLLLNLLSIIFFSFTFTVHSTTDPTDGNTIFHFFFYCFSFLLPLLAYMIDLLYAAISLKIVYKLILYEIDLN